MSARARSVTMGAERSVASTTGEADQSPSRRGAFEAVVSAIVDEATVQIRPAIRGKGRTSAARAARLAVAGYRCKVGDRVVAIDAAAGEAFVVGVLRAEGCAPQTAVPEAEVGLRTAKGATARVEEDAIVVRDAAGVVVVVYDSARGEARIVAGSGDLAISAPSGRVVISAGTDLELRGGEAAKIVAPEVECTATHASLHAAESSLNAGRVRVAAEELISLVGRYELRAGRVLHKAIDAYYEIDGVMQTRAGQLRTVVKGAMRWFSKRTSVVSEEDTFIDGKRVLLG